MDLQEGDHIFRYGAIFKNSILTHHGIYIGNSEVIHFSGGGKQTNLGENIKDAKIKIVSLSDFMGDYQKCYRVIDHYTPELRSEIVRKAYNQLNSNFGGYNPSTNNCEHFANWCRTDNKTSLQTDVISDASQFLIESFGISKNKINNINMYINNAKKILKPLESISSKVTLTNSIFDIITNVILK